MIKKYRHEYKYRLDSCQAAIMEARVSALLKPDIHANQSGAYLIKSLYFDDLEDSCFFDNEDGYNIRSKFRIRYYNDDPEYIRLEKKSKQSGMTYKESCVISKEQCLMFMAGRIPDVTADMPQIMQELFTQMRFKNMKPKVIVVYERKPFICNMGNVRVTFDRNLSSSNEIGRFLEPEIAIRPIMQTGESLLEVKWDELLPGYIREQLALDSLQWTSFSKYQLCRKFDCYGGI